MKITAILLAAGQGTRMRSGLSKVLHPVAGKPMIWHALEAIKQSTTEKPVVIIGHGADEVKKFIGNSAECILQEPQLGTGHAVMQAETYLKGKTDLVVVCYADMPLLRGETLNKLVETQKSNQGCMSLLTVIDNDSRGFGRIIRKADGTVGAIVEEYVANPEQLKIKELNVGGYCFKADWLWDALQRIKMSPKGEYYLTDTVELAIKDNLPVQATGSGIHLYRSRCEDRQGYGHHAEYTSSWQNGNWRGQRHWTEFDHSGYQNWKSLQGVGIRDGWCSARR
jgi:bifunctional UDP-N-acetylglucosamine pyrophosphorylase/glucosamine-1-phosphate N-acetyltransferase